MHQTKQSKHYAMIPEQGTLLMHDLHRYVEMEFVDKEVHKHARKHEDRLPQHLKMETKTLG